MQVKGLKQGTKTRSLVLIYCTSSNVCPGIKASELIWSLESNNWRNEIFRLRTKAWKKEKFISSRKIKQRANLENGVAADRQTDRQKGTHRWKCIKMTSSQYDRLVGKTPGVGGQLVTVGGLSDMISSSAGAKVPWHTDTCCQYAHILTHMHAQAHKHTLWIPANKELDLVVRVTGWRKPLNPPYVQLDLHLASSACSWPLYIVIRGSLHHGCTE